MRIQDTEGRVYIDFSSGIAVNALGHSDSGFVEVSYYLMRLSN